MIKKQTLLGFLLFLLVVVQSLFAQTNKLDAKVVVFQEKALLECIYNYTIDAPLKDSIDKTQKEVYTTILQTNGSVSKFWDWNSFKKDSIIYFSKENISTDSIRKLNSKYHNRVKNLFTSTVFKNYPNMKITVTDNIIPDDYIYQENKVDINWILNDDTLTVCEYLCNKAICSFGGREWMVWYAPEITISDGPWKLYGLPGLILKAEDSTSTHIFEAVAIRKSERPIYLEMNSTRYETTKKQFEKKKYEFESLDPKEIFDASNMDLKGSTTILIDGHRFVVVKPNKYCPLELE